jgi:hypothetical protein
MMDTTHRLRWYGSSLSRPAYRERTAASRDVFTPKERERMREVTAALTSGTNPYAKSHKGAQGAASLIDKKPPSRLPEVRPAERKRRLKRWTERTEGGKDRKSVYRLGDYPNSPVKHWGFPPANPDEARKPRCSFCGIPVELIRATFGTNLRSTRRAETVILPDGTATIDMKTVFYSHDVIACPKCCLKVKPTPDVDRATGKVYGIARQNQKFPETPG